jgi:CARDB
VNYCVRRQICKGADTLLCNSLFRSTNDIFQRLPLLLTLDAISQATVATANLAPRKLSCAPEFTIRVENNGGANAAASTTRVEVLATVPIPVDIETPAIPAGGFVDLEPPTLPDFCSTRCSITITADVNNDVDESDEANNIVETSCP